MSNALLVTKLTPPLPRADFIPRPRLTQRIHPKRGRITVITAPAGYGKTTLLAEFCAALQKSNAAQKNRVAYFALDAADNDPALFWQYVAVAFKLETFEVSRDLEGFVNRLVNQLARTHESIHFILDDLHVIHTKEILGELGRFIEHAPQNVQITLASRIEPKLPLARWRARGQLNELGAAQLAFTRSEARAFLHTTMQLNVEEATVARLEKMTEGWAAALQLAALAVQNDDAPRAISRAHIFEYLASEVFAKQSKTLQTFLLDTCLPERVGVELANALTQRNNSAKLFTLLLRTNLFINALDPEQTWYRYHPLFAEFLQKRLHQSSTERERVLHQRAAQWFAQNNLYPEAIDHALAARDFELARAWIDFACDAAMQRGQLATMERWLNALPAALVASSPSLNLWYGWLLCLQKRFDAMDTHLRVAENAVRKWARKNAAWKREATLVRGKIAAIRAQAAQLQNNHRQTLYWSQRALQQLPTHIRNERSVVLLNLAHAYEQLIKPDRAERAIAEAVHVSRAANHPFIHFSALYAHAELLWRHGDTKRAQSQLRRAVEYARQKNVSAFIESAEQLLEEISRAPSIPHAHDALSTREREILQHLARGETNPQIAVRLNIGVGTVNWHTKNIYKKLGVRNRTEAARLASI